LVEISRVDAFIKSNDYVKVIDMGNIIEVQYMQKSNMRANILKISKYEYIDLSTGEIKQFELSNNRGDNLNSLRQTFKKLGYLINNNFSNKKNELWITMTYAENQTDLDIVAKDFDKFLKKLKYHSEKRFGYEKGQFEFIKVLEPQERGAWHMHLLVKYPNKRSVFIPNEDYAKWWGKGFVTVQNPDNANNLGLYLTSYLTNVLYEPEKNIDIEKYNRDLLFTKGVTDIKQAVTDKNKSVVKGGRLHLYPSGMNIFSKSEGIAYPEKKVMKYDEVRNRLKFKDENMTFRKSIKILDKENDFENIIIIEQYNKNVETSNILVELTKWYERLEQSKGDKYWVKFVLEEIRKLENKYVIAEAKKNVIIA